MKEVKLNSYWSTTQSVMFKVVDIKKEKNKNIVFYVKEGDDKRIYSCFEEAFVTRFFQFNNHKY